MNKLSRKLLILVVAVTTFSISHSSSALTVFNINDGDVAALKAAIISSNSDGDDDQINLATNGNYILTTIDNSFYGPSGLPVIGPDNGHRLFISGYNTTITRDGNAPLFRIFTIVSLPNNGSRVDFQNILITNGNLAAQNGSQGGGIYCFGAALSLNYCTISGNLAGSGGGIFLEQADATLNSCTLSNNSGGAIWNEAVNGSSNSSVVLDTCTLAGNMSADGGPSGAAVYCYNENTPHFVEAELLHCTLSGNGISLRDATVSGVNYVTMFLESCMLRGSLLESSGNVFIKDGGYNLSSDSGGGFLTSATDQINTDPLLDPLGLQGNGGPTQTIALTWGSPAIDKGDGGYDQRNIKPYDNPSILNASNGNGRDIGAYEVGKDEDAVQGGTGFVVTTTDDHNDGVCSGADCTLREAVARANRVAGPSSIIFARNLTGIITLNPDPQHPIGELAVTDSLTITGTPIGTISGNSASRIFNFSGGSSSLIGLTIRDGFNHGTNFPGQTNMGGGIYNSATLSVYGCTFINNYVAGVINSSGANGGAGQGGGIYNSGTLILDASTFAQTNEASGGNGGNGIGRNGSGSGGAGQGGAIFNDTGGSLTVTNSTFAQNMALGGNGGSGGPNGGNGGNGVGAAIFNLGTMTITSATISGNSGSGGAPGTGGTNGVPGSGSGGVSVAGGAATLANTIVAANPGSNGGSSDTDGAFTSSGYNLIGIGDFSSGWNTANGDQVGTTASAIDPHLSPLQYNGGSTNTMAPLSNSSAIDRGKSFGLTSDQRGRSRPYDDPTIANASGGDGSDIGAVEIDSGPTPTSVVSRKVHGPASFDILLSPNTLGDECRSGGPGGNYTLIFTFAAPVTFSSASVCSGTGSVSTAFASGNTITVNLTGVTNLQTLDVCLTNVSDGTVTGSVSSPFRVLIGDTNGDGTVNSADISLTKSKSGQAAVTANFREDLNVDDTVNSSDVSLAKSKSGTGLP